MMGVGRHPWEQDTANNWWPVGHYTETCTYREPAGNRGSSYQQCNDPFTTRLKFQGKFEGYKEEFRFKNQYAGFPHFYELQTFPLDLLGLSLIILNLFFHLVLAYVRFRDPLWKIQPWLCLWSKKEKITLLHKQTLRSSDLNKSENWNESEFRQYLHKHHKLLRTQNEKCLHNGNIILPVVIRFHVSWPF